MRYKTAIAFFAMVLAATAAARASEDSAPTAPVTNTPSFNDLGKSLGLRFFGDFRFRFTYLVQGQDYAPTYDSSTPLYIDHELNYRIRARLGAEKSFGQDAKVGLAFISAGDGDPADPYWTLSGAGTFKQVGLDQAYFTWVPGFLDKKMTLTLGKFTNPLTYTPITWCEDVAPEGLALLIEPVQDTKLTVLYFRMVDNGPATVEGAGADPFMADIQLQQKFNIADAQVAFTAGYQYISNVASYETGNAAASMAYFSNPTNPPGAPLSITSTSEGMVGDHTNGDQIPEMHVVEGILNVSHTIGEEKIPVLWTFHAAYNLSSFTINAATNAAITNTGINDSNDLAFFAGLDVGKADHAGEWAGGFQWGYIEPDAVFSAYNDPNPGLGHNNNTWFMGKVEMGLDEGLSLCAAQYMDWRVNYDVFGTAPMNIIGTTSRDPILRTLIDLTTKL